MGNINLSAEQQAVIQLPFSGRYFLEGAAGTGKTTSSANRLLHMLASGIPAESILVLVPQRTLAEPYYAALRQPDLPAGGVASIVTLGGLAQRLIDLFWPVIAAQAGFAHPEQPPAFLTLETAQYYLSRLVRPLLDQGYFDSVVIDRNRLFSQILDNLNKAAGAGFDFTTIGARLQAASLGKPSEQHVYQEAQECANLFRRYCLDNNLLDFSLQMEVFHYHLWPSLLCREYLFASYDHLIYDNIEEDVPVVHDIVRQWLPHFDSALLINDSRGGFRNFLGADSISAASLENECEQVIAFTHSWVLNPGLAGLRDSIVEAINHRSFEAAVEIESVIQPSFHRFTPQMLNWISRRIHQLVYKEQVPPAEIVVLSPFLSDSLRFSLMNRLEKLTVPARSHRPSRSLREEPATQCLLTLARLAHPIWNLPPTLPDVRSALIQSIEGLDMVRADLLARITYRPSHWQEGLGSFDRIQPEMRDRITYHLGQRFEELRTWLNEYRTAEPAELDIFLSRLFGEILSQAGYAFHLNYDSATVTARLIESIRKFRWGTAAALAAENRAIGQEYIQMVSEGVVAAQYIQSWNTAEEDAVLLAPAYTFLMMNRPVSYQFWLDIGSQGWYERLYQPLTHPYVLSRHWPGTSVWTDADENAVNQDTLARLTTGLIQRCRRGIFLCVNAINEQGNEQRGPLLYAVQSILRQLDIPVAMEE